MRHPLVTKVNKAFQDSFKEWRAPRSIGLRLLGDCMRRTILDLSATEPRIPDTAGMYNMSFGSAYEWWMIERFKVAGLLKYGGTIGQDIQINIRLPQYEANGFLDALILEAGKEYAVEIKTCSSRRFNELIKNRKPDRLHYYQLMAYMHFGKYPNGLLIYIDREKYFEDINGEDVPRWEVLEVKYDEELGQKLEKRAKRLAEHKKNGTIPDKEPKNPSDKRCTWCTHRKYCWGSLADSGKIRVSDRAKRIAKNSKTRRRKRASIGGAKSSE